MGAPRGAFSRKRYETIVICIMKAGVTAGAVARPAPSISQEPVRESHDRLRKRKMVVAIVRSLVRGGKVNEGIRRDSDSRGSTGDTSAISLAGRRQRGGIARVYDSSE